MIKDFETWFEKYGITDHYLRQSLSPWQVGAIKKIAKRAYDKGKLSTLNK